MQMLNNIASTPTIFNGVQLLTIVITIAVAAAFLIVFITNRIILRRVRQKTSQTKEMTGIMKHALKQGNINVVRFMTGPGYVHNVYGSLLAENSISLDDFMKRIHLEDQSLFMHFIQRMANREEKADECVCRFLSENGTWRNMKCQAIVEERYVPVNILCTMTDETEDIAEQKEEQELTDKYRMIFDRSIVGLAFYDKNGMLLAANQYMRELRRFQSEDDPFYFETSMFDMPLYRDVLDKHHVEELYFCTRNVIPERGVNAYVEVRLHPILDDQGQLLYISVATRDISAERDLYLTGKQNDLEILRANESIRHYENELKYLLENSQMLGMRAVNATQRVDFFKELNKSELQMGYQALCDHIIDDGTLTEGSLCIDNLIQNFAKPTSQLFKMRNLYDGKTTEWYLVNTVPETDADGNANGWFGLVRNVTSLMHAQEQLKKETERANDSGRQKSVFLANMTHEIRTPLNAIVGFSDVLTMIDSPEEKQEMVRVIMNNCDMLLRLINDILEISTMDTNTIALDPKDVDFALEFKDICESLSQRVQTPSVKFVTDNPFATLLITIDTRRVQQVITNFVTNAVKYTQQGHIRVGYRLEERLLTDEKLHEGLYVYCEDTGTGIPKEKQASVFERFVKLNDYVQGTGLGLSICKAIAERAKGQIGVDSEGEGKGSTFWMWIPFDRPVTGTETDHENSI